MDFFLTAIVFIVIFSVLVLIHECGHFFAAKKNNIKVEEFGFGLPPRIWGIKKGETIYSLNAIPFGGFVRLFGEDGNDPKMKKNARSFANKPARVRIFVVIAGVLMNFLLAFLLLTVGFIFGIEPLILNSDDVYSALQNQTIQIEPGVVVKNVKENSPAQLAGLKNEDKILQIDGREIISYEQIQSILKKKDEQSLLVTVLRDDEKKSIQITPKNSEFGIELYEVLLLPRLEVADVMEDSLLFEIGLSPEDVILKVNDVYVYSFDDFRKAFAQNINLLEIDVVRDGKVVTLHLQDEKVFSSFSSTIISSVGIDSPAEKAGLQKGDIILNINGQKVYSPNDFLNIMTNFQQQKELQNVQILYERNGTVNNVMIQPDKEGLLGVVLSPVYWPEDYGAAFFSQQFPVSAINVKNVSYPFWIAPMKALEEMKRLSVLTVEMFFNVIRSIFTRFAVPEGVAGPVGIAQLTYTFVQEGVLSLIRFMALLSLSLGIINVLPVPALDGGRLLFIVLEVIIGRKISAKYESIIHAVGFILLMAVIAAVTLSDILKLF